MNDIRTPDIIELAMSQLDSNEASKLYKLTEQTIANFGLNFSHRSLLTVLADKSCSTAYQNVWVRVNRLGREFVKPGFGMERPDILKELALILEKCRARLDSNALTAIKEPGDDQLDGGNRHELDRAIIRIYETLAGRTPVQSEIEVWKGKVHEGLPFHEFVLIMSDRNEITKKKAEHEICPESSDGRFIQYAYEVIHGRGCNGWELNHWLRFIKLNNLSRQDVVMTMFKDTVKVAENIEKYRREGGNACKVMGTNRFLSAKSWKKQVKNDEAKKNCATNASYSHRFYIKSKPSYLVTAIASLYKGGDYIERFMENITSQSCFEDYCELIIIDADSPDGEYETIKRYLGSNGRIRYIRKDHCIGVYDAWNLGIKHARGEYLTNTNVDDLRRLDSLELQASILENLSFVDVVYQDFYYTFDANMTYEEIASFNFRSDLPVVTPHNLMEFNSPHNAPMWRRSLHEDLGYFDTSYRSAGDYEFWMRCIVGKKCFYKINDPHIIYYQNPSGLSTRPDSHGLEEAMRIRKLYGRELLSDNLLMPFDEFCEQKLALDPLDWHSTEPDKYRATQQALRKLSRTRKFHRGTARRHD